MTRFPSLALPTPLKRGLACLLALQLVGCPDSETTPTPDASTELGSAEVGGDASVDVPSAVDVADDGDDAAALPDVSSDAPVPGDAPDAVPSDSEQTDVSGDTASGEVHTDVGSDTPAEPCGGGCGDGQICAPGGNCVATCAQSSPDFEPQTVFDALADGWSVLGMHCGGNLAVSAFEPLSATEVLELVGEDGSPDSVLRVDRVTFGDEVTVETMASSTIPGSIDGFGVFPGLRLKADGSQETFGYGYTGNFDAQLLLSPGQLLFGSLSNPGNPESIEASNNYDLAWIADGDWLVAGRSVNNVGTSSGVYWLNRADSNAVSRVVEGLGFASGNIAVEGNVVLAGGYSDPWPTSCPSGEASGGVGNKVFYTTIAALQAAVTSGQPIDAYCDAQEMAEIASDFSFLDDGNVISVNAFEDKLLTHHTVSVDSAGAFAVSSSRPIAVDDSLTIAKGVPGSGGHVMIKTDAGYMLIAPAF